MKIKMLIISGISFFIIISVNNRVFADETSTWRPSIKAPNKLYSQHMNERNGRNGTLIVTGSLVTTPCTLSNNEIILDRIDNINDSGKLKVLLSGCGDGAKYTAPIYADIYSELVSESEFISVYQEETGVLPPIFELLGGDNIIYIYFTDYQKRRNLARQNIMSKSNYNYSTLLLKVIYQ